MTTVPEGMIELWTIEKLKLNGKILVDDLKETQKEALEEIERRGGLPWKTFRIVVPYGKPRD